MSAYPSSLGLYNLVRLAMPDDDCPYIKVMAKHDKNDIEAIQGEGNDKSDEN